MAKESREVRKCKEFWKEFILKNLDERDKETIIRDISQEDMMEIDGLIESIMDTVLSIIVSQQKVIKDDISTDEDERRTREIVIQNIFSFNTYVSCLMAYLWERRRTCSAKFLRSMTSWLSRQVQLVLQALRAMKDFLDYIDIHFTNSATVNGPTMSITIIMRR